MAKHKKSREEKIISDLRRKLEQTAPQTYSLPTTTHNKTAYIPSAKDPYQTTYLYVLHDLRKTLFLTSTIIIAETVLLFLLRKNIFTIPYLQF